MCLRYLMKHHLPELRMTGGHLCGMTMHKLTTSSIVSLDSHNGPTLEYPKCNQQRPVGNYDRIPDATLNVEEQQPARPYGGYDPAIHGDYDPTASYAQEAGDVKPDSSDPADPNAIYTATGVFNRFTGKWQPTTLAPENFNDENKSKRQMSAFFDVDAAANSHNGKSLKAERSGKKLTKQELKAFKEKRRDKKEEKRRAWLRIDRGTLQGSAELASHGRSLEEFFFDCP
jgi:hypothetical protein